MSHWAVWSNAEFKNKTSLAVFITIIFIDFFFSKFPLQTVWVRRKKKNT